MTRSAWSAHAQRDTHKRFSAFFNELSNRVVDGTLDCETVGAEGTAAEEPQCHCLLLCKVLAHLVLKGNGTQHWSWFDLCTDQHRPMTHSESNSVFLCKYHWHSLQMGVWMESLTHTLKIFYWTHIKWMKVKIPITKLYLLHISETNMILSKKTWKVIALLLWCHPRLWKRTQATQILLEFLTWNFD